MVSSGSEPRAWEPASDTGAPSLPRWRLDLCHHTPVFVNRTPRFEPLSTDALDVIDRGWKRLVSELGIKFLHEPSLELLAREGQRVEDEVAFLDPDWVLEKIRSTPTEFTLRARNPDRDVHFGPDNMVF